jgi:REP element-mobilizing transposase RayT
MLFGEIRDGTIARSLAGQIAADEWERSAAVRPEVLFDDWVIMPNHLHALVMFAGDDRIASPLPRPRRSLGALVAGFKAVVTARIRSELGVTDAVVWQRNYYEHIVRTTTALDRIRRYIAENPSRWHLDHENDARSGDDPFDQWLDSLL